MPTLAGSIIQSLSKHEMISYLPEALFNYNRTQVRHHDETEYWDYKEQIDFDNPFEVAKTAKHILGFHNAKGGVLIIGVADDFTIKGLSPNSIPDSKVLREKLHRYIGPKVPLFVDRISVPHNKVLFLIFVPARVGPPVPVQGNGPTDKKGRSTLAKNQYYVRLHAQTMLCTEPEDYERLFAGYSLQHLQAYVYDVDEPYFRLLAPHCDRFVGRRRLLFELHDALESRHPLVTLDGIGGVGKTALGIRMARQLYTDNRYLFLVSASAKSQVWHSGRIGSRQAGFSGLTELLHCLAQVLEVELSDDIKLLKSRVVEAVAGCEGLFFVDNIESVRDPAVLTFLSREVPAPAKVLLTSRINKAWGGLVISVPEMDDEEARELFIAELDRVGYNHYIHEEEHVEEILSVTGKVPLALQWAANLAESYGSLRQTSSRLRGRTSSKEEFLTFCFATIYDQLTPLARDVAALCPHFGDEWTIRAVGIALDRSEEDVRAAAQELTERGILLASKATDENALRLLPLTVDFLASKWHENQNLRRQVQSRLTSALAMPDSEGVLLAWPRHERVRALVDRGAELRRDGNLDDAHRIIRLALSWSNDPKLDFLEGQILFELGRRGDGVSRMRHALTRAPEGLSFVDEKIYLAKALLSHGSVADQTEALQLFREGAAKSSVIDRSLLTVFTRECFERGGHRSLNDIVENMKGADPSRIHDFLQSLPIPLTDSKLIEHCGDILLQFLTAAASAPNASHEEGRRYLEVVREVTSCLTKSVDLHASSRRV